MTYEQFVDRYHLNQMDKNKVDTILAALDIMYLEFPGITAIQLTKDYLGNADEIFNTKNKLVNED